jgi:hypothetical protein
MASPNNTTFITGIVDAEGNIWTINDAGLVCVNYVADKTTADVIQLAYVNGDVWQQNSNFLWWYKKTPNSPWLPASGTSKSPLPTTPGAPTSVKAT